MTVGQSTVWLIQAKNSKLGSKALSKVERALLLEHAVRHMAVPVYAFMERGRLYLVDIRTQEYLDLPKYSKLWYSQEMKRRQRRRKNV